MKRRYLLLLIPALPVLSIIVAGLLPWETVITMENANRIKPGMSRAEVEAILGPPRDEMSGGLDLQGSGPRAKGGANPTVAELQWFSNAACIWVGFDRRGNVTWILRWPRGTETRWEGFVRRAKATVGIK